MLYPTNNFTLWAWEGRFYPHLIGLVLCCFATHYTSTAQVLEISDNQEPPYTIENLITNVLQGDGVEITNIQYEGEESAVGYFQKAQNSIGIERGVVLTTGSAKSRNASIGADSAASITSNDDNGSSATDSDIAALATANVFNLSKFEITFVPISDTLQFKYVFASEEYPEFTCRTFNDIFGFFISGPNPSGGAYSSENIALIPNTNLPVAINNVHNGNPENPACLPINAEYYNDNSTSNQLVYDAYLDVFVAEAAVVPCQEYVIKLVIADLGDAQYDSAVFLEAKSFGTNILDVDAVTVSADGSIVEGCADAEIVFQLAYEAIQAVPINFELLGTATEGVDYNNLGNNIEIPVGSSSAVLNVEAFEDFIAEPTETLGIAIERAACKRDTFWINIRDNILENPNLVDSLVFCPAAAPLPLNAALDIDLPVAPVFTNDNVTIIHPVNTAVMSTIEVAGVSPLQLNPDMIESICINQLEHPWIEDLDIYLISPSGVFIELTTDNGGDGGNDIGTDFYTNTCFTPTASQDIKLDAEVAAPPSAVPFTGEFLPEGYFSDLWTGIHPSNGTWTLMMIDDTPTAIGQLLSWSINFRASYEIEYQWTPSAGLSCTDCPTPLASPTSTTTYTVEVTDSFGCTEEDMITVFVPEALVMPSLTCDDTIVGQLMFTWSEVNGAEDYEVNINGEGWQSPNVDNTTHIVTGLGNAEEVQFEVRAIDGCGAGAIASTTCMAADCLPITISVLNNSAVSCFGQNDGSVEVNANGGTPPFSYSLNGVNNATGVFTNLAAGLYSILVQDANNCSMTMDINMDTPQVLMTSMVEVQPISCATQNNGTVTVEVTGGTGVYGFEWNNMHNDSLNTNLDAGTYTVTVTDANGCTAENQINIDAPLPIDVSGYVTTAGCNDGQNGSIDLTVVGGASDYSFNWSNQQTDEDIDNLMVGIYTVTVTDANACTSQDSFEILQDVVLENTFVVTDADCFGEASGSIITSTMGGTLPYEYIWSNGATNSTVQNLQSGIYILTITDNNECTSIDTIAISQPSDFIDGVISVSSVSCAGQSDATISIEASGGTSPYLYSLNGNTFSSNNTFIGLPPADYIVFIEDANGCITSIENTIEIDDPNPIEVELGDPIVIPLGATVVLDPIITNASGTVTVAWNSADMTTLSCIDCLMPTVDTEQTMGYGVQVVDEKGCTDEDFVTIIVDKTLEVLVPTGFSPNGDGLNDVLMVHGKSDKVQTVSLFRVYDRWGEVVFETSNFDINDANIGWDGTFQSKKMPVGVYVWYVEVLTLDGRVKSFQGETTLVE